MFPLRSRFLAFALAISTVFVLVGMLWLLQPSLATRAQSQPEALGTLSGTVRDSQGQPLANITVWLEHYQDQYQIRKVTTNGSGVFTFASVLSGNYRLRFEDTQGIYATQYYANESFPDDAAIITVNGNVVAGIEMTMQLGGSILLTVQGSEVITTAYYVATLYRQTATGAWSKYRYAYPQPDVSDVLINQLPVGAYRLCVEGHGSFYFPTAVECYDNVLPESALQLAPGATDIMVQAGSQASVTIVLNDISQLEGYVTNEQGEPVAGIHVRAVSTNSYPEHIAISDADGYFRFGYIPSGSYYIVFQTNYTGPSEYLAVHYPDDFAGNNATALPIGPSTRMSIAQQLTREARILGKVTLPEDAPLGYATINLMRQTPFGAWDPFWCFILCPTYELNVETGTFTMTQVAPGTYRIRTEHYLSGSQNFIIGYYGGNSPETATDVVVAAGETKENINIVVGANDFDSAIAGRITGNGAPLAGVEVGLFPQFWSSYLSAMPLFSTVTDADGRYRLEGLSTGYYQVAARDPQGIYATNFYATPIVYFPPGIVAITQTGTLPNIDIDLTPGGSIRGHIRTQGERQPSGYIIQVLPETGDPFVTSALPYIDEVSGPGGSFEVTGLPPGRYYLRALTPFGNGDYINQLGYYHPASADPYFAQILTVEAGKTLQGKDVHFFFSPTNYIPRIGGGIATGEPPTIFPPSVFPPPAIPPTPFPRPIPTPTPAFP